MPIINKKFQVTIPKQFRVAFGLKPGDKVEFGVEENRLVVSKKPKKIPFEKWRGYLKGIGTKKVMQELRG